MNEFLNIAQGLQDAWQNKDLTLLESLLSAENLEWYEGSFDTVLISREAVLDEWRGALENQKDLKVVVTLLDTVSERAYYACQASWVGPTNKSRVIDGIFMVRLDNHGKIIYFNQWWTAKNT